METAARTPSLPNADPEHQAAVDHFESLYSAWLEARSRHFDPKCNEPDQLAAQGDAVDEAARRLLATPAVLPWMIWQKWEALDLFICHEVSDGPWTDNRVIFALGAIKADIARFGFGEGEK